MSAARMTRRDWLGAAGACAWPAFTCLAGLAQAEQVLAPQPTRIIEPQRTFAGPFLEVGRPHGFKRARALARFDSSDRRAGNQGAHPLGQPPTAYVLTARHSGVPAWVLFGVALQESQLLYGHEALPYPWTLDVAGRAERHESYRAACDALALYLARGVTNVDCGPMQVNWRAHRALLGTPARALDPYLNLAAGARILHQGFAASGSWPAAVGLYHTGSLDSGARRERAVHYVAGVSQRLARHGLTLAQAAVLEVAAHG